MSATKAAVTTTTLSTKGQLILPKAVRESRGWKPGTQIVIEEQGEALLLREGAPEPDVKPTRLEDVYGMFAGRARMVSVEAMKLAAADGAAERYRRSFDTGPREDDA